MFWLGSISTLLLLQLLRGPLTSAVRWSILLLFVALAWEVVCWQADAMEIDRHCIGPACLLRLALWLITLLSVDALQPVCSA